MSLDSGIDASVRRMWLAYLESRSLPSAQPHPPAWHFCDNREDADACAALVLAGRKVATAPSLWFFQSRGLQLPQVGDLDIVTDWAGIAQCIIRTTAVSIVRFCDVGASHALAEGEGDGSLEFWRSVHWAYYQRELQATAFAPAENMPVVCQYFERIYP